jgi:hypothetical protein
VAISKQAAHECRTTGDDLNSGAFVAVTANPGTDYSQQDAPLIAFTDLAVDATTNTLVTSSQVGFTTAHTNNTIRIPSGVTGFTAGVYQITAVSGGVATLDRSPAAVGTTGGSGRLGGAVATPTAVFAAIVAGNDAYFKGGPFLTTAGFTLAQGNSGSTATTLPTRLIGYGTTRGDRSQATFRLSGSTSGLSVLNISVGGYYLENLTFDANALTNSNALNGTGSTLVWVVNCKGLNWRNQGFVLYANSTILGCELAGGSSGSLGGIVAGGTPVVAIGNHVHDCASHGIQLGLGCTALGNVIANITGAAADGIQMTGGTYVWRNTIYKCGRSGIRSTSNQMWGQVVQGNLIAECTGPGFQGSTAAGMPAHPTWDGNAYYANNGGVGQPQRVNVDDAGTVNPVNAIGAYTNPLDVLLTADPFTAKGSADFTLNNAAGGGAAARGFGIPRSWPGLAVGGYPDFGAIQSQAAAGGGGPRIGSGLIGGI